MNNYPDNDYRSYLEHGTLGKTWEWAKNKVKYIGKEITDSGAVRYIYSTAGKAKKAVEDYKADKKYKKSGEYEKREEKANSLKTRYIDRSGAKKYGTESTVLKEGKKTKNAISLLRPFEKYLRSRKVAKNIKKVDKQRERDVKNLEKSKKRFNRKQFINRLITPLENILKYSKRNRSAKAVAERMATVDARYNAELTRRRNVKSANKASKKKFYDDITSRQVKARKYEARSVVRKKQSKKAKAYFESNPEKNPNRR